MKNAQNFLILNLAINFLDLSIVRGPESLTLLLMLINYNIKITLLVLVFLHKNFMFPLNF
jgi:hypothetical protein